MASDNRFWRRLGGNRSRAGIVLVVALGVVLFTVLVGSPFWFPAPPLSPANRAPETLAAGTVLGQRATLGEQAPPPGERAASPGERAAPPGERAVLSSPATGEPEAVGRNDTTYAERVNVLLLGIDRREHEVGSPSRSDSMIVVSVDPVHKKAAVISLPRDMYVEIPGFRHDRINAANALGDAAQYPGGGPALAVETVEHNFGLEIDYYVLVDLQGFKKTVDALGGVTVDVPHAVEGAKYLEGIDASERDVYIPAGVQHMSGDVALEYARSRRNDSDFGRTDRQQRLLLAIRDRATRPEVVLRLPALVGALRDSIQTDIPLREWPTVARLAGEIDPADVSRLVIGPEMVTPFVGEEGAEMLMPDYARIRPEIDRVMSLD